MLTVKENLKLMISTELEKTESIDNMDIENNFESIQDALYYLGIDTTSDWFEDYCRNDDYGDSPNLYFLVQHIKIKHDDVEYLASFGIQYFYESDGTRQLVDTKSRIFVLLNLQEIQNIEETNKKTIDEMSKDPIKLAATLSRLSSNILSSLNK